MAVDTTYWATTAENNRVTGLTSKIYKVIFINRQQGFIEGLLLGCASGVGLDLLSMAFEGDIDQSGMDNPILRFIVVGSSSAIIGTITGMNNGSREEYVINLPSAAVLNVNRGKNDIRMSLKNGMWRNILS